LVPALHDEDLLKQIMHDADRAAKEVRASIIGGHTGYSSGLSRPLVAVTALGTASGRRLVRTAGAQIGDHVLITKGVALEGTAILAQDFRDIAQNLGLSDRDLDKAKALISHVSVIPEALVLAEHGATSMHDVTRGGLLETLLEISLLSSVGIELDASLVPIPSVVAQFAETFQFDPFRMISSGTLAATLPPSKVPEVMNALNRLGLLTADVGRITEGSGVRILRAGETTDYQDIRCEEDELARMWTLYPRSE
jgi:hydrogenase maturation factor